MNEPLVLPKMSDEFEPLGSRNFSLIGAFRAPKVSSLESLYSRSGPDIVWGF